MWKASLLVLVACGAPRVAPTEARVSVEPALVATAPVVTASVEPASTVRRVPEPVDPLPFAPDPHDDGTTAGAVRIPHPVEVAIPYNEVDVLEIEDLPAINAAWKRRSTIDYEGFVPIMFGLVEGRLRMYITAFDGPAENLGKYRGFDLTWTDDPTSLDQLHETPPPNIHALLHVRPTDTSPDSDLVHVAVYTPPNEKVILVATRRDVATRWRPLLRVDVPKAETIAYHVSDPH